MASKNGRSKISIEKRLLSKNARSFDFYQAIYLLQEYAAKKNKQITILPKADRAFSGTSIDKVIEADDKYIVLANLLGLYNSSSPLPNYYLEEVLNQIDNEQLETKAFLDIFHQRLYELLFEAWEEHNVPYQLFLKNNTNLEEILYSMGGLSFGPVNKLLQDMPALKKYLNNFMTGNRTLLSLQYVLSDFFNVQFKIHSYYSTNIDISKSQQNKLGQKNNQVGESFYLGETYPSKGNNILLELVSMSKQIFESFLPGGEKHQQLIKIVTSFLYHPFNVYLDLALSADDIEGVSLGGQTCNRLGQKAWLAPHAGMSPHFFTFKLRLSN